MANLAAVIGREHQRFHDEILRLQESLSQSNAQIIELLRQDDSVTTAGVTAEYSSLCHLIESVTESIQYEQLANFRRRWSEISRNPGPHELLTQIGLPGDLFPQSSEDRGGRNLARKIAWIGEQQNLDVLIYSLVIYRFLEHDIFSEPMPLGIHQEQWSFIDSVYNVMRERDSRDGRDFQHAVGRTENLTNAASRAERWKSETLNASLSTQAYAKHREEECERLVADLCRSLDNWIYPAHASKYPLGQCVDAAMKLHESMRVSRDQYRVDRVCWSQSTASDTIQYQHRNLATWREETGSNDTFAVIDLIPGLSVQCKPCSALEKLELVRPVVITVKSRNRRGPSSPVTNLSTSLAGSATSNLWTVSKITGGQQSGQHSNEGTMPPRFERRSSATSTSHGSGSRRNRWRTYQRNAGRAGSQNIAESEWSGESTDHITALSDGPLESSPAETDETDSDSSAYEHPPQRRDVSHGSVVSPDGRRRHTSPLYTTRTIEPEDVEPSTGPRRSSTTPIPATARLFNDGSWFSLLARARNSLAQRTVGMPTR